jgi:hypothetical protein
VDAVLHLAGLGARLQGAGARAERELQVHVRGRDRCGQRHEVAVTFAQPTTAKSQSYTCGCVPSRVYQ